MALSSELTIQETPKQIVWEPNGHLELNKNPELLEKIAIANLLFFA